MNSLRIHIMSALRFTKSAAIVPDKGENSVLVRFLPHAPEFLHVKQVDANDR